MRISDWSSDVCSSDLDVVQAADQGIWDANRDLNRHAGSIPLAQERGREARALVRELPPALRTGSIEEVAGGAHREVGGRDRRELVDRDRDRKRVVEGKRV